MTGGETHLQELACWPCDGGRYAAFAAMRRPDKPAPTVDRVQPREMLSGQADKHVLHVIMVIEAFEERFDFSHLLIAQATDRVLRLVAKLGRQHRETLFRQGFLYRVEVGRLGQEQGCPLFTRFEICLLYTSDAADE